MVIILGMVTVLKKQLVDLIFVTKVNIPNLNILPCLEPFQKFVVGGGWWVNPILVFSFGPS